jgi:hypothetical protein
MTTLRPLVVRRSSACLRSCRHGGCSFQARMKSAGFQGVVTAAEESLCVGMRRVLPAAGGLV